MSMKTEKIWKYIKDKLKYYFWYGLLNFGSFLVAHAEIVFFFGAVQSKMVLVFVGGSC